MVDREKLQKKINFQKTRNIVLNIKGIQVIDYEEQSLFDHEYLRKINFFSSNKIADSKISFCSSDTEVIDWINEHMDFKINQIWYIWLNGFFVKIKMLDIKKSIMDLWNNGQEKSVGFILINENKNMIYEFGSDSRDEENYLFDKYPLV